MKGKTLKQITNTPKAGLKELLSLPDNEEFNVEIISKDSGKVYTVSTDAFNSNISTASALFPNGVKEVPVSRNLTVEDVGWLLNLQDGVIVQPAEGITLAEGDIIGITGTLTSAFKIENDASLAVYMLSDTFYQNEIVVLSATNADGLETILVPISTTLIADGDVYKTALRYLYDQSQNAIPLSGTVSGSPVTGDIEVQNGLQIKSQNTAGDEYNFLSIDDVEVSLRTRGIYNSYLGVDPSGVRFDSEDPASLGLSSSKDFTANITDLDYTQKKYVDTHIAFTTVPTSSTDAGVKGQMAIDSTYLYVCVDTNTWVRTLLVTW